ncbi:MAG: hypothetical protein OXG92_07510 [Chloroflexi bacterium]|nr:hypothetical protein [Chloroflexota bacterium]MCY3581729.1 hypothetical protein [Chloroflexota bacterium]MCY3716297.1 hypothetical protein [Chloroflexota bacterium]MDE2651334.1 hypothetical protein [Chloroflexota bacterium]MXV93583.1 hypothetical protein [Chloroflexota bacterium]
MEAATKPNLAQLETRLIKWMAASQLAVIGFLYKRATGNGRATRPPNAVTICLQGRLTCLM